MYDCFNPFLSKVLVQKKAICKSKGKKVRAERKIQCLCKQNQLQKEVQVVGCRHLNKNEASVATLRSTADQY